MQPITLQDIITKKLNTLCESPDDLATDAYLALTEAYNTKEQVKAYIAAQVAIQANKACGILIPNIELDAMRVKKDSGMDDQDMADFYMEYLDK